MMGFKRIRVPLDYIKYTILYYTYKYNSRVYKRRDPQAEQITHAEISDLHKLYYYCTTQREGLLFI